MSEEVEYSEELREELDSIECKSGAIDVYIGEEVMYIKNKMK